MNFPHSKNQPLSRKAFTLLELLVVITIIAVLAGLLLPVAQRALENARKTTAKSTETQIVAAVNAYQAEYGQYPVTSATSPTDLSFGVDSKNHNSIVFDVLRALNTQPDSNNVLLNSRRITYFESKNVKSTTNPRDGFIVTGNPTGNPNVKTPIAMNVGDLIDPWGNMYCVRIDANYSGIVMNPYSSKTPKSDDTDDPANPPPTTDMTVLRTGVIAWSFGNDGISGSTNITLTPPYTPAPGDDVDSWQ